MTGILAFCAVHIPLRFFCPRNVRYVCRNRYVCAGKLSSFYARIPHASFPTFKHFIGEILKSLGTSPVAAQLIRKTHVEVTIPITARESKT